MGGDDANSLYVSIMAKNWAKLGNSNKQQKHTYICYRITTEQPVTSTLNGQSGTAYTMEASFLILTENIYQILWIALALNTPDAILLLAVLQL